MKNFCRVKRFWAREPDEIGHVVHKRGNAWAFHYDMRGDSAHDEQVSSSTPTRSSPVNTCRSKNRTGRCGPFV